MLFFRTNLVSILGKNGQMAIVAMSTLKVEKKYVMSGRVPRSNIDPARQILFVQKRSVEG